MQLALLLRELTTTLSSEPQPDVAARSIVAKALGLRSLIELATLSRETEIDSKQLADVYQMRDLLISGTPLAYLLGNAVFFGLQFKVTEDTLIPRPETEQLTDMFISDIHASEPAPLDILEVGTGSGCIGTSILYELQDEAKNLHYTGLEISKPALEVTKNNLETILHLELVATAAGYKYSDKHLHIELYNQSIAKFSTKSRFSHIISNPPYITSQEYAQLDHSVKDFEPKAALIGGIDGLTVYRQIAQFITHSGSTPRLYLEISPTIKQGAQELFGPLYEDIRVMNDLFGRERFLVAS